MGVAADGWRNVLCVRAQTAKSMFVMEWLTRLTGKVFNHMVTLITLYNWEERRNIYNYMRFNAEIQTG